MELCGHLALQLEVHTLQAAQPQDVCALDGPGNVLLCELWKASEVRLVQFQCKALPHLHMCLV